jgi:hypothetical protein
MEEKEMRKRMVALLAGAMLMMATSAMAIPTTALQVSATGAASSITIYDGDASDLAGGVDGAGVVSWFGNLGNFKFNFSGGTTNPAIGSAEVPMMHLTGAANTPGTSGGLFTVKFSSTGFGPMTEGLLGFISSMNGAGGVQSLDVYFDASNALFGQATHIADLNTINTFDVYNGIPENNPFSLTMIATIALGARDAASFDDTVAPVPEPGTMMLLGIGMLGLAVYGKRRMNKEV